MRATQHFHHDLLLSTPKEKRRKEIKLFTRERSQQAKEEQEIFLGFHIYLVLLQAWKVN